MREYQVSWQPYQLRFSLIGIEEGCPKPDLSEIFGVEVQDTAISGPRKDLRQTAMFGAGHLTMNATHTRVDFLWQSLPPMVELVRLGDLGEAVPHLLNPIRDFVQSKSWGRVAFGAVCGAQVTGRSTGYAQLDERLEEVSVNGDDTSDFLYQINRPSRVELTTGSVVLNRLQKWAVARIKFVGPGADRETGEDSLDIPDVLVAQVTLDFNTPVESERRLSGAEALAVLDQAVADSVDLIGG